MFVRDYPDHQEDLGSDRDYLSQHPSWDGWSLRLKKWIKHALGNGPGEFKDICKSVAYQLL